MKKALLLAGLFLCVSGVYAEENHHDQVADGKKRNEEIYERMLEQTGWTDSKESHSATTDTPNAPERTPASFPAKSS